MMVRPSVDDRRTLLAPLSGTGMVLGAACFLAALTPSLIPRSAAAQGALAGLACAVGYCLGAAWDGTWAYLGLSRLRGATARSTRRVAVVVALSLAVFALARVTDWQNSVRTAMGIESVESARPLRVGAIGGAVAPLLLAIGRFVRLIARHGAWILERFLPRRLAVVAAIVCTVALVWSVANGVLLRGALRGLDSTYQQVDALIDPDTPIPTDPRKTGSAESLLAWDGLGRTGRAFVAGWPGRDEVAQHTAGPALEPLRVYAGLNSAETPAERARLAFEELVRIGAFERRYLLIATPTGTGWVDPAGLAPLELLTRGDIATVAVQYSYLPSWLTLMVDTGYGAETADEVFSRVYGHWRSMPRDARPMLLLFGLSLGSVNAATALDLYELIGDPFAGALWAGPPFANRDWRELTAARRPESPVWLPRHRADSVVRFMGGADAPAPEAFAPGPMRVVYLQYASDPIVFFTGESLWRRPELLRGATPPGLSPEFRWFPVVTCLQLAFDMLVATTVPEGCGHVYSVIDYTRAWAAVIGVDEWTPTELEALEQHLAARAW